MLPAKTTDGSPTTTAAYPIGQSYGHAFMTYSTAPVILLSATVKEAHDDMIVAARCQWSDLLPLKKTRKVECAFLPALSVTESDANDAPTELTLSMLNDRRTRLDYVMFAVRHALAELRRRRLADGIPYVLFIHSNDGDERLDELAEQIQLEQHPRQLVA